MARSKQEQNEYVSHHMWMRYHYGKPQRCESCKTTDQRMYHWANISGTYQRKREDWLRLCVPCHKRNDIKALGGKIRSRPVKIQPSKLCERCNSEFLKNPKLSIAQWESTAFCSKSCSAKTTGEKLKGTKQSTETKALKSAKLKERWKKDEWREHMKVVMTGNQYARKKSNQL